MKANLTEYHGSGLHLVSSYMLDCVEPMTEDERTLFIDLAKSFAAFAGLELVAWCVPTDHFHLLVRVPPTQPAKLTDEEFLQHFETINGPEAGAKMRRTVEYYDDPARRAAIIEPVVSKVDSLGSYIKHLKGRFVTVLGHRRGENNLLWNSTYRELLIEEDNAPSAGLGHAAFIAAAYLAANPVRCGLAEDPKDYAWSSYGAAIAGDPLALQGFSLLGGGDPAECMSAIRSLIYNDPAQHRVPDGKDAPVPFAVDADAALAATGEDGKLPIGTLLRLRVRHLSHGVVLGSESYVGKIGAELGVRKKHGGAPIPLPMSDWQGLHVLSRIRGEQVQETRPSSPPGKIPNQRQYEE